MYKDYFANLSPIAQKQFPSIIVPRIREFQITRTLVGAKVLHFLFFSVISFASI